MRRTLDNANKLFRAEINAFIEVYWPKDSEVITPAHHARWREALVAKGWSVPDWPVDAGGSDWSTTQKFLWHQACAAHGVDGLTEDPATSIVGPLILQEGQAAQMQRFLPGIRDLQVKWCIGFAEPHCGTDLSGMTLAAEEMSDGFRLSGRKTWVVDAASADFLCTLARLQSSPPVADQHQFVLVAVELSDPGLTLKPVTTLDGATNMAEVELDNLWVERSNLLAGPTDGAAFAQLFTASVFSSLSRSAIAQAQLDALDGAMQGFAQDDPLYTERHAVAVDLAGLQALELRYLDAFERGVDAPVPLSLLRIKSREILLQLGALQMECFGYYALPYPDEVLLHNEGPIGPKGAVTAVRTALAQQVAALYEGNAEEMKDAIARQLEIVDNHIADH